jgi:hypothetical protein
VIADREMLVAVGRAVKTHLAEHTVTRRARDARCLAELSGAVMAATLVEFSLP